MKESLGTEILHGAEHHTFVDQYVSLYNIHRVLNATDVRHEAHRKALLDIMAEFIRMYHHHQPFFPQWLMSLYSHRKRPF